MSESPRCNHCSHKCFTDKIPNCRDPKKRPKSIHIIFNEINEKMSNGKKKNVIFYVLVEGGLDEKFWGKIKKSDSIGILRIVNPTCDNDFNHKELHHRSKSYFIKTNKNAIECIFCKGHKHLLQKQYSFEEDFFLKNQAIGMVDMDFQQPLASTDSEYDPDGNIQYDPQQFYPLFRTETRDLEILICKSGGLRHFLLNCVKLGFTDLNNNFEQNTDNILQDMLNQASIPGFARYLNADKKFFVKFDRLKKDFGVNPFCMFINKDRKLTCTDIIELLKKNEKNLHGRPSLFFAFYREQCPKREHLNNHDLWSLCQGHDTVQILECMISSGRIKCRNSGEELSGLILEEFVKNNCYDRSEMIAEIIKWEKIHHPSRFETSSTGELFVKRVYGEFNLKNSDQNNPC